MAGRAALLQPRDLSVSGASPEDALRWSSARGSALSLDRVGDATVRPIPQSVLRDQPRSLLWTRHNKSPSGPLHFELAVKCADGVGEIRWLCNYGEPMCVPTVALPYVDPEERRRHLDDVARLHRIMQTGTGARDLLVADALRLAEGACAGGRCSDRVRRAVSRLHDVAQQPPWKVTLSEDHRLLAEASDGTPGRSQGQHADRELAREIRHGLDLTDA